MAIFDQLIERKGTSSVKWDQMKSVFGKEDLLPMWVADMDFKPPEAVTQALQKRLSHEIFGYTSIPDSTGEAIREWMKKNVMIGKLKQTGFCIIMALYHL